VVAVFDSVVGDWKNLGGVRDDQVRGYVHHLGAPDGHRKKPEPVANACAAAESGPGSIDDQRNVSDQCRLVNDSVVIVKLESVK
jgi:hypothetical protein